jgi:acyl carrier protein
MEKTAADTSVEGIRSWLRERVSFYLERPVDQVDPDVPFVEMGLDSVYALTLCGDIEDQYKMSLEATVTWDYPTVTALSAHLADEIAAS